MGRAHQRKYTFAGKLGITVAMLIVASGLRWLADPYVPIPIPFTFYMPAIVVTTILCGSRWGYVCTGLSLLLAVYIWIPPQMVLRVSKIGDMWDVIVWAIVAAFIVAILSALHRAIEVQTLLAEELAQTSRDVASKAAALAESETKLRRYTSDLEREVEARTAKLAETVAELESFSYTISHDLRSPLRAMQGFSFLVLEDAGSQLTERARGHLRRIDRAAQRMDELIRDLLLFNRAGQADTAVETIDVAALVEEAVQQHPGWLEGGAVIEARRPLRPVRASHGPLFQALCNLLENAVKFVPPGRPARVEVRTERRAEMTRIVIQDNGLGMSPEFLTHIFKPFHRGHPDAGFPGRGIGLAVAKKAVLRMGGDIGVTTAVGAGSSFWIELPSADLNT